MPRHTASLWSTKTFGLPDEAQLRLGGGVVYSGKSVSTSPVWSIVTPSRTTVDALAEISWNNWRFALNATNLLDKKYYASCLARGDCFVGAPRNVMGTVGYRSEEHTSELQSLMRISYAVFCLKKKKQQTTKLTN